MIVIEVKNVRTYKAGYEVRTELVESPGDPKEEPMEMRNAYNIYGDYIGEPKIAHMLLVKRGIMPEKADMGDSVCSVGYSHKDGKWYGWSHRAIFGYKAGDMIYEENFGDDNTHFSRHGSKPVVTLADARLAAVRFADSVS